MKKRYDYESDWRAYVFPEQESYFSSTAEVKEMLSGTVMDGTEDEQAAGLPLVSDGSSIFVNSEIENTLIFGETGSKKTRCLVMPLIAALANGKKHGRHTQSMFVTDVKGELSENVRLRGFLEKEGYDLVYLDFRKFDKDSYNVLSYAYELYHRGNKDKAMANVATFIRSLSEVYDGTKADPYWQMMADQYIIPLIEMIFSVAHSKEGYAKYVNLLTLASFCNEHGVNVMESVFNRFIKTTNNATEMMKGVLSTPDKTKSCIISTVSSYFSMFLVQESLLKMLSHSSFDVRGMYEKPTCVFLIIPDETSLYDRVSGMLIDSFYQQLIDEYSLRYQHKAPTCTINWVLDEFCNLNIQEMESKISCSRGRMMRWYLVCQSKRQLESTYERAASTILGNCQNTMFLNSSDDELLGYISNMIGTTTITHSGNPEPLCSVEQLKRLKKTWEYKEAIWLRGNVKYLATLPDVDQYPCLEQYQSTHPLPCKKKPPMFTYTPDMFHADLANNRIAPPFSHQPEDIESKKAALRKEVKMEWEDFWG